MTRVGVLPGLVALAALLLVAGCPAPRAIVDLELEGCPNDTMAVQLRVTLTSSEGQTAVEDFDLDGPPGSLGAALPSGFSDRSLSVHVEGLDASGATVWERDGQVEVEAGLPARLDLCRVSPGDGGVDATDGSIDGGDVADAPLPDGPDGDLSGDGGDADVGDGADADGSVVPTAWVNVGPEGGILTTVITSVDGLTLYAGGIGGVFASTDKGLTWVARNGGLDAPDVRSIAIDGQGRLFVCTAPQGGATPRLYRSSDGGGSWDERLSGVNVVAVGPTAPGTVYAAGPPGAFVSTNGGVDWLPMNNGLTAGVFRSSLAADPTSATTAYLAGTGVFKTVDSGASWTNVSTGTPLATLTIRAIAVDGQNSQRLWAGAGPDGLFLSTDGGTSWNRIGQNQILGDAVSVYPQSDMIIYVGTMQGSVFRTTDGGTSWMSVYSGLAPIYGLARVPASGVLLAASQGSGILRSSSGLTWAPSNPGIRSHDVRGVAVDPRDSSPIWAATQRAGIFRSTDAGQTWDPVNNTLTGTLAFDLFAMVVDPTDSDTVYAASAASGVIKTTNGGNSWLSDPDAQFNGRAVAIDGANRQKLFAGSANGAWTSTTGGAFSSWVRSTDPTGTMAVPDGTVLSIAVAPTDSNRVYAGALLTEGFHISSDGGMTFMATGSMPGVTAVAVDPGDPDRVYSGNNQGSLFRSENGGGTFDPALFSYPGSEIRSIAIDPSAPTTFYVGVQYGGVHGTTNDGGKFVELNEGLDPFTQVNGITIDPANPRVVYAATTGAGVFRRVVPAP